MASPRRTPSVSDEFDDQNMLELGTATPVATQQLLYSPSETKTWVTLKEGYLLKTKFKKLHKSTKLRLFVLKQDPHSLGSRLEYYEGKQLRGYAELANARIHPEKSGVFLVQTPERTFFLQAEKGDLRVATSWVLALQQAIVTIAKSRSPSMASVASSVSPSSASSLAPPSPSAGMCMYMCVYVYVCGSVRSFPSNPPINDS